MRHEFAAAAQPNYLCCFWFGASRSAGNRFRIAAAAAALSPELAFDKSWAEKHATLVQRLTKANFKRQEFNYLERASVAGRGGRLWQRLCTAGAAQRCAT